MMQTEELLRIRDQIHLQIGRRVWIKAYGGRSRSVVSEGILENTFPSVFTVVIESEGEFHRISYTYNDILTKHLEMRVVD